MHNFSNMTVREIALEAPLSTRVFESFKIDYCCGGRVPLVEACRNAGADTFEVLAKLETVLSDRQAGFGDLPERMSPAKLIAYIVSKHHALTRAELERLGPLAEKVASRHGEHRPELAKIKRILHELTEELLLHMRKEETVLFPFIEKLETAIAVGEQAPMSPFGTVSNPIRMLCFEHDAAGDMLREMRSLSNDYSVPEDACPSFKGLFAGLEDLERDLHRHIHLENNILFPQAVAMESADLAADQS